MNVYKDRVAETELAKERIRVRVVASGEDESQHDENRMRDIHIGERGSETANKEQPDKLRTTVRFEQDAPNTSSSSTMHVSPERPVSGERQARPEPVLVQNPGHVDDDIHISAVDVFYEMDGRKSRYIKEVFIGIEKKMPEVSREVN